MRDTSFQSTFMKKYNSQEELALFEDYEKCLHERRMSQCEQSVDDFT